MEHLMTLVNWVSESTGLDKFLVVGGLFMLVGLIGKTGIRSAVSWISGEHQKIGEIAQSLLALMDMSEGWTVDDKDGSIMHTKGVSIDVKARVVDVGGEDVEPDLNTRERRLVFAKAKAIKASLASKVKKNRMVSVISFLRDSRRA